MAASAPKAGTPGLPPRLLEEARRLGVSVENRSEQEVRLDVRKAWQEENRDAIEGWNRWVEEHGIPLERYRQF